MTRAAEIAAVLEKHPGLGVHGFAVNPPLPPGGDFVEQVVRVRRWLKHRPGGRALLLRGGSYALKHHVEVETRRYVSNGALIVAAVLEGFKPVRKSSGPNCRFEE